LYFCCAMNLKGSIPLVLIMGFLFMGILVNACKKDDSGTTLNTFLTNNGPWQLASLRVLNYRGDTLRTDTLNTQCSLDQSFTFDASGLCTYRNYSCLANTATGRWRFSDDRLTLLSDIICKDTTRAGQSTPFQNVQIINLGRNSLVLQSNDTLNKAERFPKVIRRRVVQFGFIHTSR